MNSNLAYELYPNFEIYVNFSSKLVEITIVTRSRGERGGKEMEMEMGG